MGKKTSFIQLSHHSVIIQKIVTSVYIYSNHLTLEKQGWNSEQGEYPFQLNFLLINKRMRHKHGFCQHHRTGTRVVLHIYYIIVVLVKSKRHAFLRRGMLPYSIVPNNTKLANIAKYMLTSKITPKKHINI